jgi:hypothetical protein
VIGKEMLLILRSVVSDCGILAEGISFLEMR